MAEIKFCLLVLFICLIGWPARRCLMPANNPPGKDRWGSSALSLGLGALSLGMALISPVIFLLAVLGLFHLRFIILLCGSIALVFAVKSRQKGSSPSFAEAKIFALFLSCFCLIVLSSGQAAKTYQPVLAANDTSAFYSMSYQIAQSGRMVYKDPFVADLSEEEKKVFLENRHRGHFTRDTSGKWIRYPGGIPVVNLQKGLVSISFFPLFPLWMALALKAAGPIGYLYMTAVLFASILGTVILIGRRIGGWIAGIGAASALAVFFPQFYHFLIPAPELLFEFLFLTGTWFFLTSIDEDSRLPKANGIAPAMIWGSAFLAKPEAGFIIPGALGIMFVFSRRLRNILREWTAFAWILAGFFAITLFYEILRGGPYIDLFSGFARLFSEKFHPDARVIVSGILIASVIGAVFVVRRENLARFLTMPDGMTAAPAIAAAALIIPAVLINSARIQEAISKAVNLSFAIFCPSAFALLFLFAGFIVFAIFSLKGKEPCFCVMGAFMIFPLFILLQAGILSSFSRKLYSSMAPFEPRRYLSVIYPLFFLAAQGGWCFLLQRIPSGRWREFFRICVCFAAGLTVVLLAGPARKILAKPIYQNLLREIETLDRKIPERSLIIIPFELAGSALAPALQYVADREVFLLPFPSDAANPEAVSAMPLIASFLRRKLDQGRPVVVLQEGSGLMSRALTEHFDPRSLFEGEISFNKITLEDMQWGRREPYEISLRLIAYRLTDETDSSFGGNIDIGNPVSDSAHLAGGFYFAEKETDGESYRWTNGKGEVFVPGTDTVDILLGCDRPRGAPPLSGRISLNGTAVYDLEGLSHEKKWVRMSIPPPAFETGKKPVLAIETNTFSPARHSQGGDERRLGLRVYRMRCFFDKKAS